jgi:hypothetical protein
MKIKSLITIFVGMCLILVIPTNISATEVMNGEYTMNGAYNITGSYIADSNDAVISGNTTVWYSWELASLIITNYENDSQYAISMGEEYIFGITILNNYVAFFNDAGGMEAVIKTYDILTGEFTTIAPPNLYSLLFSMAYPNSTLGTSIMYGDIDMFGANIGLHYYSTNTEETYPVEITKIPVDYFVEPFMWSLPWNGEYVGCGISNDTQSKVWFGNTVTGDEFTILHGESSYFYSVISITEDNIAMLYDSTNDSMFFWDLETNESIYQSYELPTMWDGWRIGSMVGDLFWYSSYNDTDYYTTVVNASTQSEILLDAGFIGSYGMPSICQLENGTYELVLTQYGGGEGVRSINTEPNIPGDEYVGDANLYFFEPIPQNDTGETAISDMTEIITALLPVMISILVALFVLRFFMGMLIGKKKKE